MDLHVNALQQLLCPNEDDVPHVEQFLMIGIDGIFIEPWSVFQSRCYWPSEKESFRLDGSSYWLIDSSTPSEDCEEPVKRYLG
jgi:hypothetical protein